VNHTITPEQNRSAREQTRAVRRGFTLVELLVVIAIIALLAGMVVPALLRIHVRGQITKAQLHVTEIANAIHEYEQDNNRFPVSSEALAAVSSSADDFTFGTHGLSPVKTPAGTLDLVAPYSSGYQANNAEIMAVLLDLETYGNGQPTINKGHVRNTKKHPYLQPDMTHDTTSPGVGSDGVYRDPWGNPYIITLDLNHDEKSRDAFYRRQKVSQVNAGKSAGYFGMFNPGAMPDADSFEGRGGVLVWSAGPDKAVDPLQPANASANKDNILSWKQ